MPIRPSPVYMPSIYLLGESISGRSAHISEYVAVGCWMCYLATAPLHGSKIVAWYTNCETLYSPVKMAATRKNPMKMRRPMDAWPTGMPAQEYMVS